MDEKSNSVFISYRREPAWTLVEALYQRVTAAGIDVFYDTHSIRAGKFDEVILSQIRARPYFLLVLVPGTLERCGDAGDWLRREIETAIESDRLIIPVYTPNFELKSLRGDLPGRLGETLLRYNAQELPHKLFKYAVQELVEEFLIPTTIAVTAAPIEDQEEVDKLHRGASETSPVTEEQLLAQGFFEAGNLKINSRVIQPAGWGPIELADAIADYTESIRLNPNYAPTHYRRGLAYWLGRNGIADGVEDYARLAMADFDDAIRLDPGDPQAFNLRGSAHAAQRESGPEYVARALADFDEAIRLNPNDPWSWNNRGGLNARTGSWDAAATDFAEAYRLGGNATFRQNMKRARRKKLPGRVLMTDSFTERLKK